jgi:hypothetical protein
MFWLFKRLPGIQHHWGNRLNELNASFTMGNIPNYLLTVVLSEEAPEEH